MARHFLIWMIAGVLLGLLPESGWSQEKSENRNYKISVDVNKEDAEVGKRRIELLDKVLSPELIERRREIVRHFEGDYNGKISSFLQGITSANSQNTVITHVDIKFFDPGFKEQVDVEKDVSVTAILGRGGFDLWRKDLPEAQALDKLRQLISTSFSIPASHVILTVGP